MTNQLKLELSITQSELEAHLWGAAELLRGHIDASDYKQFIFPLLFFKRLCDVYDEELQTALAESGGDAEYARLPELHRFQIPAEAHWNDIRVVTENVGPALQGAMREIERVNERLYGIFGDAPWTNKQRLPDRLLIALIEHFSRHHLGLQKVSQDDLGAAYEYLIKKFADDSGHTAAEFYTNRTVVHLMTKILIVLETKNAQMIPKFLPYLVQSDAFFDWAEATSSGSLSPRTKFKHLAEFQFPLPPIERQRELVEVFDALEATIRCNEEAIESAENLKKSLMTELLTRGIGHTRFKQTEIGKIPVGWKVFLFSDAIDVNPKRPISRGETATFVSMMDITEHVRQITNSTEKPFKGGGAKFRNGDTLLARITPCLENGKTAYVDILDANEVASGSTEFIVLSGKKNIMLNEYVYYVAISPTFREDAIHSMIGTTGRYRVPNDFFNRFWIGVPSLSEQQKIVQTLRAVEAEIDVHQNYREKLRDLKREVNTDLTSMKSTDL